MVGGAGDAQREDMARLWGALEAGFREIYAADRNSMTMERYMELYNHAYKFCSGSELEAVNGTDGPGGFRFIRPAQNVGREILRRISQQHSGPKRLHNHVRQFLAAHLTALLASEKGERLREGDMDSYAEQWDEFHFSSKVLDGICAYVNRAWVDGEMVVGRPEPSRIHGVAVETWKETVFLPLADVVTGKILSLISSDREGADVNGTLLKALVESCTVSGCYESHLEQAFLQGTETFYGSEADRILNEKSFPDYLKWVEKRLEEEEKRVSLYLQGSSLQALLGTCHRVLLFRKLDTLRESLPKIMRTGSSGDLARLYRLANTANLRTAWDMPQDIEDYVYNSGLAALGDLAKRGKGEDPRAFTPAILSIYHRIGEVIESSFENESVLSAALDRGMVKFVNENPVTAASPQGVRKVPELVARYCNILLKKEPEKGGKGREREEEEGLKEDVLKVFQFLKDKDVFQSYYATMYANRLLSHTSAGEEAEASMIESLQRLCGWHYTLKLQRMNQDMRVSKDMTEAFRAWKQEKEYSSPFDFHVKILTSGQWTLSREPDFSLPPQLEDTVTKFFIFYGERHSGRRLTWLHSKGIGELASNLFYDQKYTFILSTRHMALLLQYNEADSQSVSDLVAATQLDMNTLKEEIEGLVKAKLFLLNNPEGKVKDEETVVTLNKGYKSKRIRVNMTGPQGNVGRAKREDDKIQKGITDERKFVIQAAIVRIMKARRQMTQQGLLVEVISQLAGKFAPSVDDIKANIDALIKKAYMEPSKEDANTLLYLP